MKIEKPNRIAICLNTSSEERAHEQMLTLKPIEDSFEIEWDLRYERFAGDYISFSDMINESVLCTDSEFMIFINPKSMISVEDVYTIIDDLCNGHCLSTMIAFGLWGCTKELFREIGLMDERLLGSEYEDDDILLRIIEANKSISWRYDKSRYDSPTNAPTYQNKYRGISANIFRKKWNIDTVKKTFNRSSLYLEEKKLPNRLLKNRRIDISSSWGTFKESKIEKIGIIANHMDLIRLVENSNTIDVKTSTRVIITSSSITVFSDNPIFVTIAVTRLYDNKNILVLPRLTYNANTSYKFSNNLSHTNKYGVMIWHDDHLIYANDYLKINEDLTILDHTFILNDQIFDIKNNI